jgi:hypothetical protein
VACIADPNDSGWPLNLLASGTYFSSSSLYIEKLIIKSNQIKGVPMKKMITILSLVLISSTVFAQRSGTYSELCPDGSTADIDGPSKTISNIVYSCVAACK